MGRGRQKAKHTKVARQLKYFSPDTDFSQLQNELAAEQGHEGDAWAEYADKYNDYDDEYADDYADEDIDDADEADSDEADAGDDDLDDYAKWAASAGK